MATSRKSTDTENVSAETQAKLDAARAEFANRTNKVEVEVEVETESPTIPDWAKTALKGIATIAIAAGVGFLAAPLIATASAATVAFTGWAFMSWVITIIGWIISLVAAHFATKLSCMGYTRLANMLGSSTKKE